MNKITLIGHLIKGLPGDPRTSGNRYEVVLVVERENNLERNLCYLLRGIR